MTNSAYLESKPRYEILDGLRGVAALLVVAFHLFETYSGGPLTQIINHGYLAVDFFFVLSGFVIGYAYDDRWGKMTLKDFFKRRLVRLHPMVIMGSVIGLLLFYLSDSAAFPLINQTPWYILVGIFILCCFMIPSTPSMDIRGWGELNSINGPSWSLMFEYIANIMYALFIRKLPRTILAILVILFAFLVIDRTLNLNVFGLLPNKLPYMYSSIGGWSITSSQLYIGATRLLFPFFAGLLISRYNKLISVKAGFWWCSLIIVIIFSIPRLGEENAMWLNGIYEAICILIFFPILVSMEAGSKVTGEKSIAICSFLGTISYPLYITHYPLIYMQVSWATNHPNAPTSMHIAVAVSIFILSIAIAYACLKLYDEPLREWLKEKWLHKKIKK